MIHDYGISNVKLRGLMRNADSPSEQLAKEAQGVAVLAATKGHHSALHMARQYEYADMLIALGILKATGQFKDVQVRTFPDKLIELEW